MSLRTTLLALCLTGLGACDPADPVAAPAADRATALDLQSPRLRDLAESAQDAQGLFIGRVLSIEARVSQPDEDGRVIPFHFVTFQVEDAGFGVDADARWTGRFAGGTLPDGRTLWVSEVPSFQVGQRALMAVGHGDEGSCALAGCDEGYVPVEEIGGLDQARDLLDELSVGRSGHARSADPDAAFTLVFARPPTPDELQVAAARGRARLERPLRDAGEDPAETAALEANGYNPVLAR